MWETVYGSTNRKDLRGDNSGSKHFARLPVSFRCGILVWNPVFANQDSSCSLRFLMNKVLERTCRFVRFRLSFREF